MPYTHTTWAQLKQQLAQRLSITLSTTSFWTNTEAGLLLSEALRCYGSITQRWKERGVLATSDNAAFYNLNDQLPSLFLQTLTDRDLIQELQFALMESTASQSSWSGTEMFSLDDLTQALQRRRNQLIVEAGIVLSNVTVAVPSAPIGRVPLADDTIDVRWAAWLDTEGDYYQLRRADEFGFNAFSPNWSLNPARPSQYSIAVTPPISLQLAAIPLDVGSIDLLSINSGANFSPSTTATLLGIPDQLAWVVKCGALADLLGRSGMAEDRHRATYYEQRWRQGVEIARMQSPVVQGEINGVPLQVGSLEDLERFSQPYWRNDSGTPSKIAVCGYNMIALSKVPDDVYSVTIDVVRSAPIPALDSQYVQVGREELDPILDYAEHLAKSKQGGSTLTESIPLLNNFYRFCSITNQRMRANAAFYDALGDRAIRPREQHPRRSPRETQDVTEVSS